MSVEVQAEWTLPAIRRPCYALDQILVKASSPATYVPCLLPTMNRGRGRHGVLGIIPSASHPCLRKRRGITSPLRHGTLGDFCGQDLGLGDL